MPRSDIAGYPSMSDYPKWMYHATEAPRMVKNETDEQTLLGQGWSTSYIHQEYPKYVDGIIVQNPEEEQKEEQKARHAAKAKAAEETPKEEPHAKKK